MKRIFFTFLTVIQLSYGVIYRLNDSEYLRMPPLYYIEDYDSCIYQQNGTYCYAGIDLVSDTPSELLQMIHEYSEHTTTHYNHTHINHGICLTKTCKQFIQGNKTVDRRLVLERCLNESLWRDYKLKSRVDRKIFCRTLDDTININTGDIAAAVFFTLIILLNVIGSLYDFYYVKEGEGNRFLLCFSLKRNWKKLMSQGTGDQNRERLKGFNGLRALSIMIVILSHAPMLIVLIPENPHGLEKTYYDISFHIFYNGTLIVQTFFMMTGCLMAYNVRAYAEKNELTWTMIPKGIMLRWLRLTPAYAVMMIFSMTCMKFVGSGPFWQDNVGVHIYDCYHYGWWNIVYLNNYIDNSQCMVEAWYLASDMQLYILGLFVCILAKTARSRKTVLPTLYILGFFLPGIITYLMDLDDVHVFPETFRYYFIGNSTFNHSFKPGHTNIPNFIFGLAVGNLIYEGLKDEKKVEKFKKLGFLYHLTFPTGLVFLLCGIVFYGDRPRPSIYIRAVAACLMRPVFGLLLALIFIGMVFKFESLYRRVLEWDGWQIPARLSYSAFLIHVSIIRTFLGMKTTLSRMGMVECAKEASAIIFITFLIAYPFWLFIEAPLNQAILNIFNLSNKNKRNDKAPNDKIDKIKEQSEKISVIELDDDGNKNKHEHMRL
ncbi:nose resistant to fluoxetine protein 6-like [Epargyreus clarus]|uniref:nose resistant to fluoxetine protein 6-like n=1 Tax=Epargyreus clarus TaxID=520877 RepID=UPI003C2E9C7B